GAGAGGPGEAEGLEGCLERHLELDEEHVGGPDDLLGGANVGRGEAAVGPGHDDDGVVGVGIDDDAGGAGGPGLVDEDVADVDAALAEVGQGLPAEQVGADAADEGGGGAEEGGQECLVGALAAEAELEVVPGQGLAEAWQARGAEGQINVDRADDADAR